jgi:fluoride exporter
MFAQTLAVAIGGAAGALARFGVDRAVIAGNDADLTILLMVNLTGAFALGLLTSHGTPGMSPAWRVGITTGFLGSFTTYSAITTAWLSLSLEGSALGGLGYLMGSLLAGVVSAWGGIEMGRWWREAATPHPVEDPS